MAIDEQLPIFSFRHKQLLPMAIVKKRMTTKQSKGFKRTVVVQFCTEHEYEPGYGVSERPDGCYLYLSRAKWAQHMVECAAEDRQRRQIQAERLAARCAGFLSIDDDHLAVLDHVVNVALEEFLGAQSADHVMAVFRGLDLVQIIDPEHFSGLAFPLIRQRPPELEAADAAHLKRSALDQIDSCDAVIISDYAKGAIDAAVSAELIAAAAKAGAEVLHFLRRAVDDLGQTIVMVTHDREVAEHALAHQLADQVERAYQRGTQFKKRIALTLRKDRPLADEFAIEAKGS